MPRTTTTTTTTTSPSSTTAAATVATAAMAQSKAAKRKRTAQAQAQPPPGKVARTAGPGDDEPPSLQAVISEEELEVTVDTLTTLAQHPGLTKAKLCRSLRVAVYEFRQSCATGVNAAGMFPASSMPLWHPCD